MTKKRKEKRIEANKYIIELNGKSFVNRYFLPLLLNRTSFVAEYLAASRGINSVRYGQTTFFELDEELLEKAKKLSNTIYSVEEQVKSYTKDAGFETIKLSASDRKEVFKIVIGGKEYDCIYLPKLTTGEWVSTGVRNYQFNRMAGIRIGKGKFVLLNLVAKRIDSIKLV